jgi:hypothetical protein
MMDFLKPFKDDGNENDWEMTKEGSIHDFLGIKITLGSSNRTWMMTQEGLTNNILAATDTTDCNARCQRNNYFSQSKGFWDQHEWHACFTQDLKCPMNRPF